MRTEIFAYAHMITQTELPTVTDIRPLLYIHLLTALGKQMSSTSIAQLVPNLTQ